jgi:DNA repair protein RadC
MGRVKRIRDIPFIDRPREKLKRKGTISLSDFELLEVIVSKGAFGADVSYIALQIQKLLRKGSGSLSYTALCEIKGVGPVLAARIMAMFEVSKRYSALESTPLSHLKDILARLDDIRTKSQEYLVCMSLDGGHRLIAQRTVTIGTLDTVIAHPREIFADPLSDRAACIVLAHNHPSGDVRPSSKDVSLTQQLVAAGQLLGIPLQDHIIVNKGLHFSFRQHHLL